jgi:transposase-like protein
MRYSDEEKQAALDCLAAHDGHFGETSAATGIPAATLRRWARQEQAQALDLSQVKHTLTAFQNRWRSEKVNDPQEQAQLDLLLLLTEDALLLADSIAEVIENAPLNQRASALSQVIDKILKLAELQPENDTQIIRVEYVYPNGTVHAAPYGAEADSE